MHIAQQLPLYGYERHLLVSLSFYSVIKNWISHAMLFSASWQTNLILFKINLPGGELLTVLFSCSVGIINYQCTTHRALCVCSMARECLIHLSFT